jgi:alkylation response protein AidB-like acyl-CoA dehydrogenase
LIPEIVEQMKEFGLFGATIAPEYGGLGLSATTYARIVSGSRWCGCRSPASSTRT